MFLLDTDTLSHLMYGREQVVENVRLAARPVVCSCISRMEILRGRFQAVFTAESGAKALEAQDRLQRSEAFLARLRLQSLDDVSVTEFDRLCLQKKLKKVGRGDLLIAAIALANRATLITRNLKDFSQGYPV